MELYNRIKKEMIKKFKQYIKESVELSEFKYADNIQAIIDSYSDKIEFIELNSNSINFDFGYVNNLKSIKEFSKNLYEFMNDLEVVLESLSIDGLSYKIETNRGGNFSITLSIKDNLDDMLEEVVDNIVVNYDTLCRIYKSRKNNIKLTKSKFKNISDFFSTNIWTDTDYEDWSDITKLKQIMISINPIAEEFSDEIVDYISEEMGNIYEVLYHNYNDSNDKLEIILIKK